MRDPIVVRIRVPGAPGAPAKTILFGLYPGTGITFRLTDQMIAYANFMRLYDLRADRRRRKKRRDRG